MSTAGSESAAAQLANLQSQFESQKNEVQSLTLNLAQAQADRDAALGRQDQLESDLLALRESVDQEKNRTIELEQQLASTKRSLDEGVGVQNQDLAHELETTKKQLCDEQTANQHEKEKHEKQLSEMSDELTAAHTTIEELKKGKQNVDDKLLQVQEELESANICITEKDVEIEKLKKSIETKEEKSAVPGAHELRTPDPEAPGSAERYPPIEVPKPPLTEEAATNQAVGHAGTKSGSAKPTGTLPWAPSPAPASPAKPKAPRTVTSSQFICHNVCNIYHVHTSVSCICLAYSRYIQPSQYIYSLWLYIPAIC